MQNHSHLKNKSSHSLPSIQLLPSPFIPQPKVTVSKNDVKLNHPLYPLLAVAMLVIFVLACASESSSSTNSNSFTSDTNREPVNFATASSATSPSAPVILDIPEVLGLTVTQVADKLGTATNILPFDAGDVVNFDEAGTYRDYKVGKYLFTGYYDTSDVLQGIQLMDGLSKEESSLEDWSTLLARFGLPNMIFANSSAPAALRWDNLNGYWVWLVASSPSGEPVWTIQVWLVDRAVARAETQSSTVGVAVPTGATVNDGANLRAGPGTDYAIVGSATMGQSVEVVARNQGGDWHQLRSGAWIAAFLVDNAPAGLPVAKLSVAGNKIYP